MRIAVFTLPAERSLAIPQSCAIFVRSGTVSWQTRSSDVLMDANHALLFPVTAEPAALTAGEGPAALTVLSDPSIDFGRTPCLRIVSSGAFLEHYRLTCSRNDNDAAARLADLISKIRGDAPKKPNAASAHSPSYGRVMQLYVNATLSEPFSLRSVAQACALSPFTASRVFHREAGLPLRLYMRRLRLRVSLALIASCCELADIALELGFFDHAHFTKAFRSEFGIAPSQSRDFLAAAS